jgi:hypothetical protein
MACASRVTPAVQTEREALSDAMAARDREECRGGVGRFSSASRYRYLISRTNIGPSSGCRRLLVDGPRPRFDQRRIREAAATSPLRRGLTIRERAGWCP